MRYECSHFLPTRLMLYCTLCERIVKNYLLCFAQLANITQVYIAVCHKQFEPKESLRFGKVSWRNTCAWGRTPVGALQLVPGQPLNVM